MSLVSRLNNKIDVYGKTQIENELGEVDYDYIKIKSVWCEIKCTTGSIKTTTGDIIEVDMKYKITIRTNSIKELTNDMYFVYQGMRFDIDYNIPNFKYKDSIEIYCSFVR